jgi:hypothetical protein
MTLRSIIDIDVNDADFKQFQASFEKHQAQVKALPAEWAKVAKTTGGIADTFADMTAALMAQASLLHKQAAEVAERHREEDRAERERTKKEREAEKARKESDKSHQNALNERKKAHEKIVKDTAQTAKNIAGATLDLLKWINIGGALGAIAGGFGLNSMANAIAGGQRAAGGYGVSSGELSSANVNFGRYVDAQGSISAIAAAQNDPSKQWAFSALGLNRQKDAAQVLSDLVGKGKGVYNATGGNIMDMRMQAAALLGLDLESMRRLHDLGGVGEARTNFGKDIKNLQISTAGQEGWTSFNNSLHRFGATLLTITGEALTPLLPALEGFEKEISKTLKAFLENPHMGEWIKSFGQAIANVADYIGSPKFQGDVSSFVINFGIICQKIVEGMRYLGLIPSATPTTATPSSSQFQDDYSKFKFTYLDERMGKEGGVGSAIAKAAQNNNISAALLQGIYGAESNFGANAGTSRAGAQGPFQFMPGTAKALGVDVGSLDSSANGAAKYIARLLKKYHGNVDKALAAYNWGAGNVDRDIRDFDFLWKNHLPSETKNYLKRVNSIAVVVNNNTGGAASVQAAQLPQ